jgi:FlaA1/EpsC-like NDP-sugar epimerase
MVYRLTAEGRVSLAYHQVSYRAELVRLTRAARTRFRDFFRALCDQGVRRVVLYGAGETGEVVLDALAGWSGVQVAAVLDDDPARQGGTLHGVPVLAPAALGGIEADAVVITSVTRADEIRAKLHGAAARGVPVHSIAG